MLNEKKKLANATTFQPSGKNYRLYANKSQPLIYTRVW